MLTSDLSVPGLAASGLVNSQMLPEFILASSWSALCVVHGFSCCKSNIPENFGHPPWHTCHEFCQYLCIWKSGISKLHPAGASPLRKLNACKFREWGSSKSCFLMYFRKGGCYSCPVIFIPLMVSNETHRKFSRSATVFDYTCYAELQERLRKK